MSRRRPSARLAFGLALLLGGWLANSGAGAAADVVLRLKGGSYQISGNLISFDGARFVIDVTALGTMTVDATRFDCIGAGCGANLQTAAAVRMALASRPGEQPGEKFAIHGSSTMGAELVPALIKGFAESIAGSAVKLIGAEAKETSFRIVSRTGAEQGVVTVYSGGTESAFTALESGAAEIGMAGRRINDQEAARLAPVAPDMRAAGYEHVIGLDAVAVVVSPENPVNSLSLDTLARIFSGHVKDWSELGQPAGPINVFVPARTSGMIEIFERSILGPRRLGLRADVIPITSGVDIASAVAVDRNGIGVTSLAVAGNAKSVNLELSCGLISPPSHFVVKAEEYPLARRLHFYTLGQPRLKTAQALLKYATSAEAQKIVADSQFVDQTIDALPFSAQTARIVHALGAGGPIDDIGQMRQLIADLGEARRLSLTVRFGAGSSELDAKSRQDVVRLAELLKTTELRGRSITLAGFTDGSGGAAQNTSISLRRAQQLRAVLLALSGEKALQRLVVAKGYGTLSPVACNDSEDGQRLNRRVEIWVH